MTSARELSTASLIGLAGLGAAIAAGLGYALFGGWTSDAALAAARFTARFSFLWFVAAWSASALATLWPGGWRSVLMRRRRAVGLAFAAAHTVHLAALLVAVLAFANPRSLTSIVGGGLGYVLVALMALTSNDWWVRRLSPRTWRALHATGAWAIAGIFAFSYTGRLESKPWLAIPTLTLLGAVVVLKLMAFARKWLAWPARA